MLRHLFPGLTRDRGRQAPLMGAVITVAREPGWYLEGGVPDTIDGRFRMLATISALTMVRLDELGSAGERESALLTERFVEMMETEHRELGLGDPTLGKRVRQLVGALGKRVGLWRDVASGTSEWRAATVESIYGGEPAPDALDFAMHRLQEFSARLKSAGIDELEQGKFD
jgi:cytochrome b pre-mRNA-processing protein 3